jgi:hypothetical protein
MGKRADRFNADQIGFDFDLPVHDGATAMLAGLERQICAGVSDILHGETRSRTVIAALMSDLLDEEVSRPMLDAYASPAREGHKVPLSRFLALVAVTNRHDVLDRLVRQIGAAVLVGEEIHTARLGDIDQRIEKLKAERREIAARAPVIRRRRD